MNKNDMRDYDEEVMVPPSAEQITAPFEVHLNPALFSLTDSASYPGVLVAYIKHRCSKHNYNNDDYITDPPIQELKMTSLQTLTFYGGDLQREVLSRDRIVSTGDGITVRDIFHCLSRPDDQKVRATNTRRGPNTYIEIAAAVLVE